MLNNSNFTPINEWPEQDRPREKLIEKGTSSLTDAELVAILLNTGTKNFSALDISKSLISYFGSLDNLSKASISELLERNGIGEAKAVTILAAVELGKRIQASIPDKKLVIRAPEDVSKYFGYKYTNEKQEIFSIILLDTANQVIKHVEISKGTVNQSLTHPREVFSKAIENFANTIILMHNHPSGNPNPSKEDIALTERFQKSGEILGIRVVDHIIIAGKNFTSLAGLGYL